MFGKMGHLGGPLSIGLDKYRTRKVLLPVTVLALLLVGALAADYLDYLISTNAAEEAAAEEEAEKREAAQQQQQQTTPGALDASGRAANVSRESAENELRNRCLENGYKGLSAKEKAERSRVLEEVAKARGISIYQAAGC